MQKYYFNVMGKADEYGLEFPSSLYARREGLKLLGALLADEGIQPQKDAPCIEITDESGAVLFSLGVTMSDRRDQIAA